MQFGSIIVIAIKQLEVCNFTRCTGAWLSRKDCKTLKIGLENTRQKRPNRYQGRRATGA